MSKLGDAVRNYRARSQFNDAPLLEKVIEAAREEEREKWPILIDAARALHKGLGLALKPIDDIQS